MHPSLASTLWKALGPQQVGRPLPTLAMEMPFGCQLLPPAESSLEIGANVTVRPQVRGGVGMVCLSRWKVGGQQTSVSLAMTRAPGCAHCSLERPQLSESWFTPTSLLQTPGCPSRCLDLVSSDSMGTEVVTYSPEISQGLSDKHPKPGQKLPPWSRQRRCGPSISL